MSNDVDLGFRTRLRCTSLLSAMMTAADTALTGRPPSSSLTTSSVGPSRFASTGVRVLVSERWTFFCSSGALVSSGRGACTASLIDENSNPVSFRVRLLQSLGDLLHPAQLSEARAAYDHPAREREPRLKGSAEEAEPGQARRVDL